MKHFSLLAAGLLALTGSSQAANLIVNGSFEDPIIGNGTYQIGGITGWYSTMGDGGEIQRSAAGTPFDGAQLLELDGNQNSNLLQDIPAPTTSVYSLSFQYSPRPNIGSASNPVEIYFGGTLLDTLTGDGGGDTMWTYYNYMVSPELDGISTLEFRAAGTSDSLGGYIDDVKLEARTPNNVPEGGSALVLLAAGLLGLEGARRRFKKA